jgi:acetate---CoA ligase (ADP-forming)
MTEQRDSSDLSGLFDARGIAVLGATEGNSRAGGRALQVLKMVDYNGPIYPVNPSHAVIQDLKAYKSVADVPDPVELAVISLSAERVPDAIRECARRGLRGAVVFADGFSDRPDVESDLRAALNEARALSGLRMIGPNTIGMRAMTSNVFATFAGDIELGTKVGSVAFISQSGGLGTYFGKTSLERRGVGMRYLIDTGNEIDVTAADCVDHVARDPAVNCIGLMIEGSKDGRGLARAAERAVALGKHVVFFKSGRSSEGLAQAASHTGALAGRAELFDAEMRAIGAHVVQDESEMIDSIVLCAHGKVPAGRGLGVVTSSGGFGVLSVDAAIAHGLTAPEPTIPPTEEQKAELSSTKFANPFDTSSSISAGPKGPETALDWMISQPGIDAVVMFHFYSAYKPDRQERMFSLMAGAAKRTKKPVFVCGVAPPEFEKRLLNAGVICFEESARLARALSLVAPRPQASDRPVSTAADTPHQGTVSGAAARKAMAHLQNLPHVETTIVRDADDVRTRQKQLGKRIILKVESDQHAHKSEFGLVEGPLDAAEIDEAFARLVAARAACGAQNTPVVMQPFERGVELVLGAYTDPIFGPAVMVGIGGIFLEVLKDVAFAAAPVPIARAKQMILGLKGAPLLLGARGKPVADIDAAAAALSDLSQFLADAKGAYSEIDINPLIVREKGRGVVAVDALLVRGEAEGRH